GRCRCLQIAWDAQAPNRGVARALDASNRGFRLLQKMGWKQGQGLGKTCQGMVEPLQMKENLVCLGLGKAEEYDAMTEQATKARRKLDSEVVETKEEEASRLAKSAQQDAIHADVKAMNASFFCHDCQKQYKTVLEMENHLSSYDHHHCKRLREMQKASLAMSHEDRAEKRKREEEKEAMRLQKRIEMAAAVAAAAAPSAQPPTAATVAPSKLTRTNEPTTLKKMAVGFSFGASGMKKKKAGPVVKLQPSVFGNSE
ncbi:TPA: hypothetical protein N0F65_009818, partial [Lagenidium giganteum]